MTTAASPSNGLRTLYAEESAKIQQDFARNLDGPAALAQRTALVDQLCIRLWQEFIAPDANEPEGFALVALGGYGRRWLFPHSDIDLLFLHSRQDGEQKFRDQVRALSQELWDARLKLSPATRTLAECDRFDPKNVEFTLSLLDCRFLAGDRSLFDRLRHKILPKLIVRESQTLVQGLAEVTRERHARFSNTVFHLEPNVKECPGGIRDYNVSCWLALISSVDKLGDWPESDSLLPASSRRQLESALEFLMSVRTFLHYRRGRDDNTLAWEAQEEASLRRVGARDADVGDASEWMRLYFGHARIVDRLCAQLLEEIPAAWSSVYRQFQSWRARLSNADFSVVDGLIFLQHPASLHDPEMLLSTFHFMAQHGLKLSRTTEYRIEQVLPSLAATPPRGAELWLYLGEILTQPHAASALRAMASLHLLTLLLPDWKAIDSLVVRDFYHRYTVDEHSFVAIDSLHQLKDSQSEWDRRFSEILDELEQPEMLYLALLLHDIGKGLSADNHVRASVEVAERAADRLDLERAEKETLSFLIASHLEMSAALRRDIFDPETIHQFAEKVGTPERLKMLCLLTYADIKAVNPEALTPWKAENVWQLYIATANHLNRSVDERLHVTRSDQNDDHNLAQLRSLVPSAGRKLQGFLEGLPRRYLRMHGPQDVFRHIDMAARIAQNALQLDLQRGRQWYVLTLVTSDRPFLFASVAGVLAAWGMNIAKADAFSNQVGIVVDTFHFTDRFRTLELNLPEWERFKQSVADVLTGKADLERMLRDRLRSDKNGSLKVKVPTQVTLNDACSSHSTLVEIVTQDKPGLLYRIGSLLWEQKCNIEIALIDTEGPMAIDVFYLTCGGKKLTQEHQERLHQALLTGI